MKPTLRLGVILLLASSVVIAGAVALGPPILIVATVAGVAGVASLAVAVRRPTLGLYIFIGGISVYYFIQAILKYRFGFSDLTVSILSRWQILFLLAVACGAIVARRSSRAARENYVLADAYTATKQSSINVVDLLMVAFACVVLIYVPTAPSALAAAYSVSNLLQFQVAYLTGRIALTSGRNALPALIGVSAVLAAFGAAQPLLLGGAAFYQTITNAVPFSYLQETGAGLPRAASLLGSPGYFGSYLMIAIPFALAELMVASTRGFRLMITAAASTAILVGLLASFHRSSWIGSLVGCTFVAAIALTQTRRSAVVVCIAAVLVVVVGQTIGIARALDTVINLSDFSSASHLDHSQSYVGEVLSHPFGLGLGAAGNVAAYLGNSNPDAPGLEGGYSQVALQVGWLGLILFVLLHVAAVVAILRRPHRRRLSTLQLGAAGALVAVLIFNLALPFQAFNPALMILWLLVGGAVTTAHQPATVGELRQPARAGRPWFLPN